MYSIEFTNRFKKDMKRCQKRGHNMSELKSIIDLLQKTGKLPQIYKPHKLSGNYAGMWECHIKPDWLLVWKQDNDIMTLIMMSTGTHSDLF